MLKFLWLLFLSLIFGTFLVFINFTYWWDYLSFFIKEQLLISLLSILWFNAASITFLITQIATIEWDFSASKNEIFHNFIWMLIIFLIEFILISWYHFCKDWVICLNSDWYNYIFFIIIISLFIFFIYLFYEVMHWIIYLSNNLSSSKSNGSK